MKKNTKLSIIVFVIFTTGFLLFQFTSNEEDSIRLDIKDNFKIYSKIINKIKATNFKSNYGKSLSVSELPESIKMEILKLEKGKTIDYLVIRKHSLTNYHRIEIHLDGNWHIEYADLPNDFPKPNTFESENFIETWGVTKNWMIWHDEDYI